MSDLINKHGDDAVRLILETLRERARLQERGLQISTRTAQRLLRERFGRDACVSLCLHVEETLIAMRVLTLFDRSLRRKIYEVNIGRIPTVEVLA